MILSYNHIPFEVVQEWQSNTKQECCIRFKIISFMNDGEQRNLLYVSFSGLPSTEPDLISFMELFQFK